MAGCKIPSLVQNGTYKQKAYRKSGNESMLTRVLLIKVS